MFHFFTIFLVGVILQNLCQFWWLWKNHLHLLVEVIIFNLVQIWNSVKMYSSNILYFFVKHCSLIFFSFLSLVSYFWLKICMADFYQRKGSAFRVIVLVTYLFNFRFSKSLSKSVLINSIWRGYQCGLICSLDGCMWIKGSITEALHSGN